TGMDAGGEEYVNLGWCFVTEKAKVGGKANVDPKPRMKGVDTKLPAGSAFDGHVQDVPLALAFAGAQRHPRCLRIGRVKSDSRVRCRPWPSKLLGSSHGHS